jgi:hypothetical protein
MKNSWMWIDIIERYDTEQKFYTNSACRFLLFVARRDAMHSSCTWSMFVCMRIARG